MSAISLKSITGITSITTPAGVDNQLTLHNNNTTEAVKLDVAGNLHFHNHLSITGVSTASNFKTGTSNLHNTGLNVQDLDVDGHTNLDNVSIAGVSTFSEGVIIPDSKALSLGNRVVGSTTGDLRLYHDGSNSYIDEIGAGNLFIRNGSNNSIFCQTSGTVQLYYNGNDKLATSNTGVTVSGTLVAGALDISGDIDVDGHTNLDNVSIAGVTTISYSGTAQYGLDVYNPTSGGSGARVRAGDSDNNYALLVENGAGTNLFEVLAGGGGARLRSGDLFILDKITHYGESNTHIRFPANDTISFETSGDERLRITSTGEVGVGNDSPNCRLAVKDTATHTAYAGVTPSVGNCMLQLYNNPSSEAVNNHSTLQFGVYGGSHNRVNTISAVAESASNRKMAFTFCTDSGANRNERMRITGDGLVGINETSPGTYLHVKGTGEMLRLETTASGGGQCYIDFDDETATRASIGLRGSSSDTLTIAALNSGLRFDVQNANSALLINSNGCLQHGTASGVSYFTGSSEYIFGSTTSSPPSGGYESLLQVHTSKTRSAFALAGYNNNSGGPFMTFLSSRSTTRGTLGSKVNNGDTLGEIRFTGDNSTNYNTVAFGARIMAKAASTPGDGDTTIAGRMMFSTGTANAGSDQTQMEIREDGALMLKRGRVNNNGSQLYCWGGYIAGTGTLSFDVPVFTAGNIYRIDAFYSHHSLSYGAYKYGIYGAYSGHSGLQINNDISSHSSGNNGSWTITRGSAGQPIVIAKTAGTYSGGGYYFVNVYAGNNAAL